LIAVDEIVAPADVSAARILVVDDDPLNVALMVRMLARFGYTCCASTLDSRAVQELQRSNRYDLIILDLRMPGFDGFEVMAALAEVAGPRPPSVLVTSAEPDHKKRSLQAGATGFLSKPYEMANLRSTVRSTLEARLKDS
jgi:CheY-like chemotaxis protein